MTLYIWGGDVFENVFRRVQIEARECINWLWVRPFSGMRTTVIVAAMLVEQLELFPPLITIGNRMLPQPMRWVRFASAGRTFCPVATPPVKPVLVQH